MPGMPAIGWFLLGVAMREVAHLVVALVRGHRAKNEGAGSVSNSWIEERLKVRKLD